MNQSTLVVAQMNKAIKAARQLFAIGDLTKKELGETIAAIVNTARLRLNA